MKNKKTYFCYQRCGRCGGRARLWCRVQRIQWRSERAEAGTRRSPSASQSGTSSRAEWRRQAACWVWDRALHDTKSYDSKHNTWMLFNYQHSMYTTIHSSEKIFCDWSTITAL